MKKLGIAAITAVAGYALLVVHLEPRTATTKGVNLEALQSISLSIPKAHAGVCFFKYEYVSGMNKICIYDCLGSDTAITVKSHQLCPITINR